MESKLTADMLAQKVPMPNGLYFNKDARYVAAHIHAALIHGRFIGAADWDSEILTVEKLQEMLQDALENRGYVLYVP